MSGARVSPSLALAAYAETWISGAKVVVFGDASSPLAERLLERGARLVQVFDSDAARVAQATAIAHSKQVSYAPLDQAGSSSRDGVFDVGIVEDLASAEQHPELLLGPLAKALSRRGLALVAARNPEIGQRLIPPSVEAEQPIGYYELYEIVNQHFAEVRMLGQTAFVGYAVADFGAADDAEVRIDTSFLPNGAEEPEWFVALVSTLPVTAESFSVIQIPFADLGQPAAIESEQLEQVELAEQARQAAETKVSQLEAKLSLLEANLEKLRAREPKEPSKDQKLQIQALQAELVKREEWLAGLEARAATADSRADAVQSELDQSQVESRKWKVELDRFRLERAKSQTELEQFQLERARSKAELDQLQLERARSKAELDQLQLERARNKAELERANAEKARYKAELDQLQHENGKGKAELERSSLDKAKSRAEREQLERRLEDEARAKKSGDDSVRALKQELDKLHKSNELSTRSAAKLEDEARSLQKRVDQLTNELRASEQALAKHAAAGNEEGTAELKELEAGLRERAVEVARLEEALHKTERFGRQLIGELTQLKAAPGGDSTKQELLTLARRNAELEADLEALRWTISSLEANLDTDSREGLATVSAKRRDDTLRVDPLSGDPRGAQRAD